MLAYGISMLAHPTPPCHWLQPGGILHQVATLKLHDFAIPVQDLRTTVTHLNLSGEQLHAADRAARAQTSAAYGQWAAVQQGEGDDAAVAAAEATYHEAARIEACLQSDWFAGLSRADMVQMGDGAGVWVAMAQRLEDQWAHEAK